MEEEQVQAPGDGVIMAADDAQHQQQDDEAAAEIVQGEDAIGNSPGDSPDGGD